MSDKKHSTDEMLSEVLTGDGRGAAREWVALTDGSGHAAHIARTRRGLFLVRADSSVRDALAGGALRVSLGLFTDRITIEDAPFTVQGKDRARLRRLIARTRLSSDAPLRIAGASCLIEPHTPRERAALAVRLPPDAELLLYLHSASTVAVSSPIADEGAAPMRFGLTADDAFTVAVTELGDFVFKSHERPSRVTGDGFVASGRMHAPEQNREKWPLAERLSGLGPDDRILAAALLNGHAAKTDPRFREATVTLLTQLAARGDRRADIVKFFWGHALELETAPDGDALSLAMGTLLHEPNGPDALAALYTDIGLDLAAGAHLLATAQKVADANRSIALHERLHNDILDTEGAAHPQADADYGQHLSAAGQPIRALAVVRGRLARLGAHTSREYLEAPEAPLSIFPVRDKLHRVRSACRNEDDHTLQSHMEWAHAAPLSTDALSALADVAPSRLCEKARTVLALVAEDGLLRGSALPFDQKPRPLDPEDTDALRHPEATHKDMLIALQEMVAAREKPDVKSLRAFCQRVDPQKHPQLAKVVADAIYCFRLKDVDVFVSAGNKSTGVRAYTDSPRLVLVGEEHLDASSPDFLDERELRFCVGAEIAHIAFGHIRVTPGQVWQGAWDVGKTGLDLALSLLPAFKGAKLLERVGTVLNVGRKAVKKVDKDTQRAIRRESVGVQTEALLEAHRLMQLSADRAGLLLCQDLRAALRGIYVGDTEGLTVATRHGLANALNMRTDDGEFTHPTRRLRAHALVAFYLSTHYDAISDALFAAERTA